MPDAEDRKLIGEVMHAMVTDDDVIDEVVAAARTSPEVAKLPAAETRRRVRVLLAAGVAPLGRPAAEPPADNPGAELLGADRAAQGVPLTGLLRGVQAGRRRVLEIGVSRSRAAGVSDAVLLDTMLNLDRHAGAMEQQVIHGYRTAELELARTSSHARTLLLRRLLYGAPGGGYRGAPEVGTAGGFFPHSPCAPVSARTPAPAPEDVLQAGLHPDGRYHCLLSDFAGPVQARALERRLSVPDSLFGLVEGRLAGLTKRLPGGDLPAEGPLLVVSPAVALSDVPTVYRLCADALHAVAGYGLRGPHHLTDLAGETALAAQPALAELLTADLLSALRPADDFHRQLALTALAYLDHAHRLDHTAAALHVHPNTVRYRLARLAKVTGVPLDASLAVLPTLRWWWALHTWLGHRASPAARVPT